MARNLSWLDVSVYAEARAKDIYDLLSCHIVAGKDIKVYGVPQGGVFVAILIAKALKQYVTLKAEMTKKELVAIRANGCRPRGQVLNWKCDITITLVEDPSIADVFVDDIVDSGKTKARYLKIKKIPFISLVKKEKGVFTSFPWERMSGDNSGVHDNIVRILQYLGEDPDREGLKETPDRVVKSYDTLFGGYKLDPKDVIKVFTDGSCDEMVVLKNIEFYSTCEHHMLPFFGKAHIAYLPNKKVIGVSKLIRLLEIFSRRLQIQERLCQEVTEALDKYLEPNGSACIMEAQHFCITARGVQKQHSIMTTSSLTGSFKDKPQTRVELLDLIRS